MPAERLALTQGQGLYEVVLGLVAVENQSPDLATACDGVRTLVLIGARLVEGLGRFCTVFHERPGVTMLTAKAGCRHINLLRVLVDSNAQYGVATQVVREHAAFGVGLAVEDDLLVVADGERGVDILQLTNGQVQTEVVVVSVVLAFRGVVVAALGSTDTVPEERNLVRTDNYRCINGIHAVNDQLQHIDTVATEAVLSGAEVDSLRIVALAVPVVVFTFIDVVNEDVRVDAEYVQRQDNRRVATEVFERVAIYTGLGQCLVAEGVAATLTNRLGDAGLNSVFYTQVQDVLYTVISCCILDGLDVAISLVVLVVTPSVGQFATTNGSILLDYNHLKISINGDDTVTSRG